MFSQLRKACCAALAALLLLAALTEPSTAQHHAIVEWFADLSPAPHAAQGPPVLGAKSRLMGRVTVAVDFPHQTITFHVDAKNIPGIGKIEVRTNRSRGDYGGPSIFTIYDANDGPFTGSLTKTVGGAAFTYVATPILNSRAAIVIVTHANPDGEIAGAIVMHKRYEK
jgi:hypothetical protein